MRRTVDRFPGGMRALVVAVLAGIGVVVAAWWLGPWQLADDQPAQRQVSATVTEPAECVSGDPVERVQYDDGGASREAALHACGHDSGETVAVTVPTDRTGGETTAQLAGADTGEDGLRRAIGLGLITLSCIGGGGYAALLARRRTAATDDDRAPLAGVARP